MDQNKGQRSSQRGSHSSPGSGSQPPNRLPLPGDTISSFQKAGATSDNIGLLFARYLRFTHSRESDWDMGNYSTGTKKSDTAKRWNLEQLIKAQIALNKQWQTGIFSTLIQRWQAMVKSQNAEPFPLTPEWRFVVGLGDKTALEVGFTFHRIYGFPIIPGSALKGLARAAALNEITDKLGVSRLSLSQTKEYADHKPKPKPTPLDLLDNWLTADDERITDKRETKKEVTKLLYDLEKEVGRPLDQLAKTNQLLITSFRRIFGNQHAAGGAIFFDAVPAEAPKLELDVMNVHYPDYYGDKGLPPSDNQNPNPIPFLTVGRSPFWFAVGWRGQVDRAGLDQAVKWLKAGLSEFGVGAKTAAGYGYFY